MRLTEITFLKIGDKYKAIGIYETNGDPVTSALVEGQSYWLVRREAKKMAYAASVRFSDLTKEALEREPLAKII